MTYNAGVVENVFFVTWTDSVSRSESDEIVVSVKAAREQTGTPLVFVAVVSASSAPPDKDTRKVMGENMSRLLEFCESVHVVIPSKGLRSAMQRSVAATLLLVTHKADRMKVHSSVEEALRSAPSVAPKARQIMQAARTQGLIA